MPTPLATRIAAALGRRVVREAPLGGGDLGAVRRVTLDDGRTVVAKAGTGLRREARMLAALRVAGAPTPDVLHVDDDVLVLEDVPDAGRLDAATWEDLGAVLARLHADVGTAYGWDEDAAFGDVVLANAWTDAWPRFWAERRLAAHLPHLPPDLAARVERLAGTLDARLPAHPPAALLHGDLWTGNVLASGGRVTALIDPAAYRGHGEVDLAMLHLFGRPGPTLDAAYGAPPDAGERRPIYQLEPALVHLRLFGPGYRGLVDRLLRMTGV
ncbi:MAG: fructosamine kinase family protein [Trueperaceae bacterium]|nr:fructosamine kinase family protein [Trueperaceae bacterium]